MLTKLRPQPDGNSQNQSCREQEAVISPYETPFISQSRFNFPVCKDTSANSQGFPHVDNLVCKAAENSSQGASMKGYTRSTRRTSGMQPPSLDSSFGSHHSTSFSSEDIRGIGAWTSAGRRSRDMLHNVSPSISLNESASADRVDERSFYDGRIERRSEKAQVVKDVEALFR